MSNLEKRFEQLRVQKDETILHINTLGRFEVSVNGTKVPDKAWGRDKTVQLFQYLVTSRNRHSLHKEQIIDRLWNESGQAEGNRNFKVAMHGINKVLEPARRPRTEPLFILRQGVAYQLNGQLSWIDAKSLEDYIALGNESLTTDIHLAEKCFRAAITLYQGIYLPNRTFEDWSSEERERIQVLILSAYLTLADLILPSQPLETVRLTQLALAIDNTWEDAYQLQMKAYINKGNRPAAMKTFQRCIKVLDKEFGLDPLPETQNIYDSIILGAEV